MARAISHLITHDGSFHADDVLAYALLHELFPVAKLIRTRDLEPIASADPSTTIVFDVGDVYDVSLNRFDHHQVDRPLRVNGRPYSAFGLVWQKYGRDYLRLILSEGASIDRVWSWIDHAVVQPIDAIDNGMIEDPHHPALHALSLSALLIAFEPDPANLEEGAETRAFHRAASVASEILAAKARTMAVHIRDENLVREIIKRSGGKDWIELPRRMAFMAQMMEAGAEGIDYVVFPSRNGEWTLTAVATTPNGFELRKALPMEWAGLRDGQLAAVSGVGDAIFCHVGRFVASAGSREGVMKLLELARSSPTRPRS